MCRRSVTGGGSNSGPGAETRPGTGGSSKPVRAAAACSREVRHTHQRKRHTSCARSSSASWPQPLSPARSPSPRRPTPTRPTAPAHEGRRHRTPPIRERQPPRPVRVADHPRTASSSRARRAAPRSPTRPRRRAPVPRCAGVPRPLILTRAERAVLPSGGGRARAVRLTENAGSQFLGGMNDPAGRARPSEAQRRSSTRLRCDQGADGPVSAHCDAQLRSQRVTPPTRSRLTDET